MLYPAQTYPGHAMLRASSSLQPSPFYFYILIELTAACRPSEPRGKGGVAAYVCAKVSPKRRVVCWEGADVRGRSSGALLTPDVMQLLTSLRSPANGGGSRAGEGGAARWAGIELHKGKGGTLPSQQLSTKRGHY